jgi:hypothetical protein
MPDKIYILRRLLIFPNTQYPHLKAFIISGADIDGNYHLADTDMESVYNDFWSKELSNEQKVPAIQQMLRDLEAENGETFNYIQRNKPEP